MKVVKLLKYLDKFLKILKTDRNTFFTYILTLLTIYFAVDRVVEFLLITFTGISADYWGPFMYTFAIACPVFAFLFSGSSKFAKSDAHKHTIFYLYIIALYILIVSMAVQWANAGVWLGLLSLPNYPGIATEFWHQFRPALSALAIYLPLSTILPLIRWLYGTINDSKDIRDSIADYGGIDLSDKKSGHGPYTCEIEICQDKESGKVIKMPEIRRFDSTLVVGVSGSGKTSLIFEPMIARDMDRKFFLKEVSKEMGFTALKTGLATLSCPYTNEYVNQHFNLNMLIPNPNKLDVYQAFMKKLIYSASSSQIVYRNLGITYIAPDYESISHMVTVAENYKLPYNLLDPNNPDSPGINPFALDDAVQTSVAISSVLKGLYSISKPDNALAFRENAAAQVIENVSILLKLAYPPLHNGDLPNLEDMLDIFGDFSIAENLCETLKKNEDYKHEYKALINYFENNFYAGSIGYEDTKKYVFTASTQLETLLRYPGVKNILCNRSNNLSFDSVLENGEINFVCTRRGDLGASAHKAFGLFYILLMQHSVLKRPGNENTRIPHFLYMDEFPDFICGATEAIFTLYRKYRVGTVISAQNLDQLGVENGKYKQTILANCNNKIIFGNATPEDIVWWEKEMEEKKEWKWGKTYNSDKVEYDSKLSGIEYAHKPYFKAGKIKSLKFKRCVYKIKDTSGKSMVGEGKLDFMSAKYKEPKKVKVYDFEKFTNGIYDDAHSRHLDNKKSLRIPKYKGHFDDMTGDVDPISLNNSDTKFVYDNEDAIIFDLKRDTKKE